jgi:hypothetical protein
MARTCFSSACGPNVALASRWKALRATNTIERLHEELRRRLQTHGSLPSEDTAGVLLFRPVAAGKSGCGELTAGRRSPPCSGSRPAEPHVEAASPQPALFRI